MKGIYGEKVQKLKGYRSPTDDEIKQIYYIMLPQLKKNRHFMKIMKVIFLICSIIFTISVMIKLPLVGKNLSELIIGIIIMTVLWIVYIAIQKSLSTNQILETNVSQGRYQVLDVVSYQQHYNQEEGRKIGSIRIQTRDGILCCGNYVVDIETALLCEKGVKREIPLLLLYDKETNESRVFSEQMLNGRCKV